jgi:hypothetical protein
VTTDNVLKITDNIRNTTTTSETHEQSSLWRSEPHKENVGCDGASEPRKNYVGCDGATEPRKNNVGCNGASEHRKNNVGCDAAI